MREIRPHVYYMKAFILSNCVAINLLFAPLLVVVVIVA